MATEAPQIAERVSPPRLNESLTTPATTEIPTMCHPVSRSSFRKELGPAITNTSRNKQAVATRVETNAAETLEAGMVMGL